MKPETVSIVTPTLNQAAFLPHTLASVANQDYPSIEHIVQDGGSTDGTIDILRAAERTLGYWESSADGGQAEAINRGWSRASGSIIAWLNSDDTLLPGAVPAAVEFFRAHPDVAIVYGDTQFTNEHGMPITLGGARRDFDFSRFVLECENPIPQPSAFIRRSVLNSVGGLDASLHYIMDWDFWLRAGVRHKIAYVPERWSTYRIHDGSKTRIAAYTRSVPAELERVYHRFFAL